MKQYEYRRDFVSRYYPRDQETELLKKLGKEGWLLCSQSGPDSVGTKIFYFVREIET